MKESLAEIIAKIHESGSINDLIETLQTTLHTLDVEDSIGVYFLNEASGSLDKYFSINEKDIPEKANEFIFQNLMNSDDDQIKPNDQNIITEFHFNVAYKLCYQGSIYGCMVVISNKTLSEEMNAICPSIAKSISSELIKLQLLESANSEAHLAQSKLHGMYSSLEFIKNSDLETILIKLMNLALQTIGGQVGSIIIKENDTLVTKIDMGFSDEIAQALLNKANDRYIDYAFQQEEAIHITDTKSSDLIDVSGLSVNLTSIITVPLRTQSHSLGLLNIINNEENFDAINYEALLSICNLSSYALENAILQQKSLENARLKESMDIAQNIQSSLLPEPSLIMGKIEVFGWSQACDETGGDYYDLFSVEDKLNVIVGDATGHGIGAALTMLITRSSLRTLYQQQLPLHQIFNILNNRIAADTSDEKFMTLFNGCIDIKNSTLTYCSAGHDGPMFIRENQETIELEATGIPLGMMENMDYDLVENIPLQSGDIIITGSDGTWEAMNNNKEEFGKQKIIEIAKKHKAESAQFINEQIQNAIKDFIKDYKIRDDMTLIVIKVN